ncbi:patatin-like phospholipase family protein [Pasteurellaceae bacterium LIM206]|nr:patatin-like phospholipase family protein [Pasteurellaceae bacterium LIM206]
MWKTGILLGWTMLLSACSLVTYQPVETITQINTNQGYRLKNQLINGQNDGNLIILMFSGGGSRAASLGYGVLEQFNQAYIRPTAKGGTLLENIDLVYGVSGGSVLAGYFSLYGRETIPKFENNFLKKNFQSEVIGQIFSVSNLPRLSSPQFGRGDLLQEQLDLSLYKGATFGDLTFRRKGPFAVISATDMSTGTKISFTQETFDALCLNLADLKISRAVAASSSVPLVFAPITLNNNSGNCHYQIPIEIRTNMVEATGARAKNIEEVANLMSSYQNRQERPYLHLVDGGLTDNLGLSNLLDVKDAVGEDQMRTRLRQTKLKRIIVINVNAQNEVTDEIDKTADVPGMSAVINTIVNVPIDRNTQTTLRNFRTFADMWNKEMKKQKAADRINMYFVSLSLKDLPESKLKKDVLNISTSFYLPDSDVNKLKLAAQILLQNSQEYQQVLHELQ